MNTAFATVAALLLLVACGACGGDLYDDPPAPKEPLVAPAPVAPAPDTGDVICPPPCETDKECPKGTCLPLSPEGKKHFAGCEGLRPIGDLFETSNRFCKPLGGWPDWYGPYDIYFLSP